jgi:superfamily II DNA helicase RecQ
MAYRFFVVPIRNPEPGQGEINAFLRSHRVLAVERRWVEQGENSGWSFCVDYLESAGSSPTSSKDHGSRMKVDHREPLSPEDFAVFARLRELRKEIAQSEAVPIYMVFTNQQLAQMVQARATTKAAREQIAGMGDAPSGWRRSRRRRPRSGRRRPWRFPAVRHQPPERPSS